MRRIQVALLAPLLGFLTVDVAFAAKAANGPLIKLFEQTWQEDLADDPIGATATGDSRYNHLLPNLSIEAIDARQKKNYTRLAALRKIKRDKLDKPDQLNYDLFERDIKTRIGEYQFKPWVFAVRPGEGPQMLAEVAEFAPFKTVKDYDNWVARINASGPYIDQWIVQLQAAVTERNTQPRVIVNKVLEQMKALSPRTRRRIRSTRRSRRSRTASPPPRRRACKAPRRPRSRPWRSRRTSASTRSSALSIYPARATRSASTTSRAANSTTATASTTSRPSRTWTPRASTTSASRK